MNDSPVDCQNCEWTEPQRDPSPTDSNLCWLYSAKKQVTPPDGCRVVSYFNLV